VLILAGKTRLAVECLFYVIDQKIASPREITAIPVASDQGIDTWQPSFRKAAISRGVPVVPVEHAKQLDGIFISLEYDKIVRSNEFRSRLMLNVHFSALPAYKGC